jgi:hypothetical protein
MRDSITMSLSPYRSSRELGDDDAFQHEVFFNPEPGFRDTDEAAAKR